jgi:hypothetical protein
LYCWFRADRPLPKVDERLIPVDEGLPKVDGRLIPVDEGLPEVDGRPPHVDGRLIHVDEGFPEVDGRLFMVFLLFRFWRKARVTAPVSRRVPLWRVIPPEWSN